jgi:hypothetical protein
VKKIHQAQSDIMVKFFLTQSVVLLYTKQLALGTLIERSRVSLPMISMKLTDHNLKYQPAGVVLGVGLGWSITGLFNGESDHDTGTGASRNIRH